MKSSTLLDSALFQLTPTRTRCDLLISANGKIEKLASGLLNPFLAHLKTAQEQMAKGGYSIILERPESDTDVSWFSKGTVERFVRFVSTPEVLERVYTLESEILQIEEAITIQGNSESASNTVEDSPVKPVENSEASRTALDNSDEKAIVLYSPGTNQPESNGSTTQVGNSKVQLLKVLETRKTVLQKEQGMAFARAVAAGFDIDNIPPLMSFSECFGALRLRDACKRFKELWKKKHETGQWVEIEAAEAMSNRSDFTAMNASGIMLSSVAANAKLSPESNGKASLLMSPDERPSPPPGQPEYLQGQFPHQMFPAWPIQSPPSTMPMFQPYPMPYYQNYPGVVGPFFQPPHPASDDPRLNPGLRMGQKRHSMDSGNGNTTESETWEAVDDQRTRSLDEAEFEKESRKRGGNRSGKKKPGVVVIRNINYITSKGKNNSEDGSESGTESEADEDNVKNSSKSLKEKEIVDSTEAEGGGHWEAFQNFLLRDSSEDKRSNDQGMFSTENKAGSKRRQSRTGGDDPILFGGEGNGEARNGGLDVQNMGGNTGRLRRSSTDEPMGSRSNGLNGDGDGQGDVLSSEANGRRLGYRRSTNDDFMADRQSGYAASSSDPLAMNGFERNTDRRSSNDAGDDSYIVLRGQGRNESRNSAVDVDSELPSVDRNKVESHRVYEPEELSMMPRRGNENGATGLNNPALGYEMQGALRSRKSKEAASDAAKQGTRKMKSKPVEDDRKRNVGPIRRAKPSKLSPMDEARARADKMRTYKADLLKMKKEKEAAEAKRLEALKMERQKRIAARGGSTLPAPPPATRKTVPTRNLSSSFRGSKFSDSEPGLISPLQRSHTRTASVASNDSQKTSRTVSRLSSGGSLSVGHRVSRSATSLPALKKESNSVASETKVASMARLRRLSEPRLGNHPISLLRAKSTEPASKSKTLSEGKKLSAIVNHDKGKAATLPELKIRSPQSKSSAKEALITATQKGSSVKSLTTINSDSVAAKRNEKFTSRSNDDDVDENPIVEKTVVVLECEKPEENHTIRTTTNEIASSNSRKGTPIVEAAVKPYHAPHARASSFEDPCTDNSEYGRAAPTSLDPTGSASFKAQVFDSRGLKLEKIPEIAEKTQTKDSSSSSSSAVKGIRRLLKFGRKSSGGGSGGEHTSELDNVSLNGSDGDDNSAVSGQVHSLKNLILQDETLTPEANTQKSSRHFSLLSPFRSSKSSDKKLTS